MSENVKLLLTDADISWAAKVGDEFLTWEEWIPGVTGKLIELGDGPILKGILTMVNKKASPYIPDGMKDNLQLALADCRDGDKNYSVAIDQIDQIGHEILLLTQVNDSTKSIIIWGLQTVEVILNGLIENAGKNKIKDPTPPPPQPPYD